MSDKPVCDKLMSDKQVFDSHANFDNNYNFSVQRVLLAIFIFLDFAVEFK